MVTASVSAPAPAPAPAPALAPTTATIAAKVRRSSTHTTVGSSAEAMRNTSKMTTTKTTTKTTTMSSSSSSQDIAGSRPTNADPATSRTGNAGSVTARSRVEKVRCATGVGYVGLGTSEKDMENVDPHDTRAIVWFDIDNTLYQKSTRIAELMDQRIHAYFLGFGFSEDEAKQLHKQYYNQHGLAIRGLLKNHADIDPLDYDRRVDGSLPLEEILKPEAALTSLIQDLDRTKCRVFALTNAYKTHALRCIRLLGLDQLFDGIVYCDYAAGPQLCCKPDKEYFDAAAELIGVRNTARFFFVDDSAKNIQAAKEMKWHSSVFYNEDNSSNDVAMKSQAGTDARCVQKFSDSLAAVQTSGSYLDKQAIQQAIRDMAQPLRIKLINIVLDAASPTDLLSVRHSLDRHLRSTRDIVSHLPDDIVARIFQSLTIKELVSCRQVSKKWFSITQSPKLWRSHALDLTKTDPEPIRPPEHENQWENVVKGLFFRERNWSLGLAQSVQFCRGHSGFVTAMKLRDRTTLVTGSYDGTIRIWDLAPVSGPVCQRTIKADKIACLDFLPKEGVVAAGLYDTGRIMLFDLHSGAHLQTLSGHNKGIRNVALNASSLVSVGQDKAICVWDYRFGERIVRFGQQSNVSLGVSLVGEDKLVAVTIDGVVRSFSIRSKRMIGEFHISKIVKSDSRCSAYAKDFSTEAGMLSWFAAHRNSITVASKTVITHLEWREHVEPLLSAEDARKRRDSSESVASTATSRATPASTPRKRINSGGSEASLRSNTSTRMQVRRSLNGSSTVSSPTHSRIANAPTSPFSSPKLKFVHKSGILSKRDSLASPLSPTMSSAAFSSTEAASSAETFSTKLVPDLTVAPRVVSILRTPEVATGAIHPQKRRVVCSSRFSSRAGAERSLFTSTFAASPDQGSSVASSAPTGDQQPTTAHNGFVALSGAWDAHSNELSSPERNPMAIVLDHESVVVGCSDGLVYRVSFVGASYHPQESGAKSSSVYTNGSATATPDASIGDAVIKDLDQLRNIDGWRELFVQTKC